jgi:hypothetical protein
MDDSDFEKFWAAYPKKVARGYARKIFARLSAEQQFAATQALPRHIRYWKLSGRSWDYLPHASTWLASECWADELEMPDASAGNDWMKTQAGISAKAREVGITAKLGEDWHSLKARILGAMRAA